MNIDQQEGQDIGEQKTSESNKYFQEETICKINESKGYSESISGSVDSKKSKVYSNGSIRSITDIPYKKFKNCSNEIIFCKDQDFKKMQHSFKNSSSSVESSVLNDKRKQTSRFEQGSLQSFKDNQNIKQNSYQSFRKIKAESYFLKQSRFSQQNKKEEDQISESYSDKKEIAKEQEKEESVKSDLISKIKTSSATDLQISKSSLSQDEKQNDQNIELTNNFESFTDIQLSNQNNSLLKNQNSRSTNNFETLPETQPSIQNKKEQKSERYQQILQGEGIYRSKRNKQKIRDNTLNEYDNLDKYFRSSQKLSKNQDKNKNYSNANQMNKEMKKLFEFVSKREEKLNISYFQLKNNKERLESIYSTYNF